MSVIYLKHPVHGSKVAISDHEANYDEMHGWKRYNPETPVAAAPEDVPVEAVNLMAEPKRRGRPRTKQED